MLFKFVQCGIKNSVHVVRLNFGLKLTLKGITWRNIVYKVHSNDVRLMILCRSVSTSVETDLIYLILW